MSIALSNELIKIIIEWDVENWSHALQFWSSKSSLDLSTSRVLEIGGRNGGLSLFSALKGATVVCSDITDPSEKAKKVHEQYGVSNHISYEVVDAKAIKFPHESFDIVVCKSVLPSMKTFHGQKLMCNEVHRVLKPEGEFWFAENLQASLLHKLGRKFWVPWSKDLRYLSIKDLKNLCSKYNELFVQPWGFLGTFGRTEKQRNVLGKIDRYISWFIPERWRYIAIGLAKK